MTPKEFFEFAKKNNAKMVDLKFTDLFGHVAALHLPSGVPGRKGL